MQYGNGITSTWTYFDQPGAAVVNFKVKDHLTGTNGSLQNLHYTYDRVGNVSTIIDNLFTGSRAFTYDALSRLISATDLTVD